MNFAPSPPGPTVPGDPRAIGAAGVVPPPTARAPSPGHTSGGRVGRRWVKTGVRAPSPGTAPLFPLLVKVELFVAHSLRGRGRGSPTLRGRPLAPVPLPRPRLLPTALHIRGWWGDFQGVAGTPTARTARGSPGSGGRIPAGPSRHPSAASRMASRSPAPSTSLMGRWPSSVAWGRSGRSPRRGRPGRPARGTSLGRSRPDRGRAARTEAVDSCHRAAMKKAAVPILARMGTAAVSVSAERRRPGAISCAGQAGPACASRRSRGPPWS